MQSRSCKEVDLLGLFGILHRQQLEDELPRPWAGLAMPPRGMTLCSLAEAHEGRTADLSLAVIHSSPSSWSYLFPLVGVFRAPSYPGLSPW